MDALCAQTFAFIFTFSFLYPSSRLIRDVVAEKEQKTRELMRAMGLRIGTLMTSWLVTYVIIAAIQAAVITGMTSQNIFKVRVNTRCVHAGRCKRPMSHGDTAHTHREFVYLTCSEVKKSTCS